MTEGNDISGGRKDAVRDQKTKPAGESLIIHRDQQAENMDWEGEGWYRPTLVAPGAVCLIIATLYCWNKHVYLK